MDRLRESMMRHGLIPAVAVLAAAIFTSCGGGGGTTTVTVTTGPESTSEAPSSQATTPEGTIGDALTLTDEYESDGVDKDDRLELTLLSVSEKAAPDGDPYEVKAALPKGYKFLRLRVKVKQLGETESGSFGPEKFSAIDAEDQQYPAVTGEIFSPPLFPKNGAQLSLPPGESRVGYVPIPVPANAEISKISVTDAGYVPPSTAIWSLDG